MPSIFPFSTTWPFYAGFIAVVLVLLLIDLGVFHRKAKAESVPRALAWSVVWIVISLLFNWGFYLYLLDSLPRTPEIAAARGMTSEALANQLGLEFLTGYVIEKAMSVDNLFVFYVIFKFFGITGKYQHRVLFMGILGALVFRALFITSGAFLMQFRVIEIIFGALLMWTGFKVAFGPEKEIQPEKNPLIRLMKRYLPVTEQLDGQYFFVRRNGVLMATPLFVTLIVVEMSDIMFAIDSVPAIFAITREPMIVFTSNVFAILGLRALYFVLAGIVHKFHLLKYGLGLVLAFVGLKMVWLHHHFEGKFPIVVSLSIIVGAIALSIFASLVVKPRGSKA